MVLVGTHAIVEMLKGANFQGMLYVCRQTGNPKELSEAAALAGVLVRNVTCDELTRLAGTSDHKNAVLVGTGKSRTYHSLPEAEEVLQSPTSLVVVLDGVTDPHNLGAVIRSGDLMAADLLIVPGKNSARDTQTVAKVSSGASVWLPMVTVPNLPRAIKHLKDLGFWVYGADMEGKSCVELDLKGKVALVLGSEGSGLGRLVAETCDDFVRIPTSGHIDSLNVSVAAGILMYEVKRQQGFPGFPRMDKIRSAK